MGSSSPAPKGKKVSRKWSETEVAALVAAINRVSVSSEGLNWAEIARAVPGRTGKQCREKYKNDLRPDISKDPWVSREEYILARAHCDVGNQWAEIAKYLPGRSENSLKNNWNATLRSKAEAKTRTFLWVYGRMVLEQQGVTSLATFERAVQAYQLIPQAEPLEQIRVPEEYFQRKKPEFTGSPIKVKIGHAARAKASSRSNRRRYDVSDSEDDFDEYDDTTEEESSQGAPAARVSTRRSGSVRPSAATSGSSAPMGSSTMGAYSQPKAYGQAAPMPSSEPLAYSQPVSGMSDTFPLDGDAAVTIRLTGFNMGGGIQKHMSFGTGMFSAMPMPAPPPVPMPAPGPGPYSLQAQWSAPQAHSVPAVAAQQTDDWSDEYMDFLKEFSMDADVPAPVDGIMPASARKQGKSALAKAVEDQAGDLELFSLLGGLTADDTLHPGIKKEQSLDSLHDLGLADYGADVLGSVFDLDAAADFNTGVAHLTTSKVSHQSTSDSYGVSGYQQRAMPMTSSISPFKQGADFGFNDIEFEGQRIALPPPGPSHACSMPSRMSGMLPPRPPAPLMQDKFQTWRPPVPTLKRVSSDALPYSSSYDDGADMWARPTKMRSYQSDELPVLDIGAQ